LTIFNKPADGDGIRALFDHAWQIVPRKTSTARYNLESAQQ
jgi:hypothetical protein